MGLNLKSIASVHGALKLLELVNNGKLLHLIETSPLFSRSWPLWPSSSPGWQLMRMVCTRCTDLSLTTSGWVTPPWSPGSSSSPATSWVWCSGTRWPGGRWEKNEKIRFYIPIHLSCSLSRSKKKVDVFLVLLHCCDLLEKLRIFYKDLHFTDTSWIMFQFF